MSFSSDVKKELCSKENRARHCDIAELAGILNTSGEISINGNGLQIKMNTENPAVARKIFTIIKKTFNVSCSVTINRLPQFKKSRVYSIVLNEQPQTEKILLAAGLIAKNSNNEFTIKKHISSTVINSTCCKKAYLRGAFIAAGSVSDPEKSYHMELINTDEKVSKELLKLMNFFELNAKIVLRKGLNVVYLKESENIADLLNIMEAHISLLKFENTRVVKDMRNQVNRIVNCETANLDKTVGASINQIESIKFIFEEKGMGYLSQQLLEVARLRLEYPEASLKEIGLMLKPQVGKSGVNHRLRKICEIAEKIKGGQL